MIEFKKDILTKDGKKIKEAKWVLNKIIIKPLKILVVFDIYDNNSNVPLLDFEINNNENRFVFLSDTSNYKKLMKSMNTKTKLFGQIKSLIGVDK